MYKDEEKKFDIRVVEKYIQEGSITRAQLDAYLKELPDVSSNVDGEYHFEFPPVPQKVKRNPPLPPEQRVTSPEDEKEA